jgi:glutathione S-transferase
MTAPLSLIGTYGSPYSLKMRAVLRYRRIPFTWVLQNTPGQFALPKPPVAIIPVLGFPDETGTVTEVMVDSTPQIARLETMFRERSLVPPDPALAFLHLLIEDYADEWLTKAMYHYRWAPPEAVERARRLLPVWPMLHEDDDRLAQWGDWVVDRQVGRRALVGSTDANAPVIESSYVRLLEILNRIVEAQDFVLGDRPGSGDFGLFGQLSQLVIIEPTSTALCFEHAPRVYSWVNRVDDLSWWAIEGDEGWVDRATLPSVTLAPLLAEIGATYTPFMLANEAALEAEQPEVVCEILGREYRQGAFPYQGKTIRWIREARAALSDADRAWVDGVLAGSGCEALFA